MNELNIYDEQAASTLFLFRFWSRGNPDGVQMYCMSKKSWSILLSKVLHKVFQDFLDILTVYKTTSG